jgi:hypothetical protein
MAEVILAKRLIVLGRNSKVWQSLKKSHFLVSTPILAIGHAELTTFRFLSGDNVLVFSYSRSAKENFLLLEHLSKQNKVSVFYISSASTNVTSVTRCYNYPRVKQQALEDAISICNAKIINIGWFYNVVEELPSGLTVATSVDEIAMLIQEGMPSSDRFLNLFHLVERPFRSGFEKKLYSLYGVLMKGCGRYPCLLRPIDLILRILGMRWYGYLYLSNRLWSTTI